VGYRSGPRARRHEVRLLGESCTNDPTAAPLLSEDRRGHLLQGARASCLWGGDRHRARAVAGAAGQVVPPGRAPGVRETRARSRGGPEGRINARTPKQPSAGRPKEHEMTNVAGDRWLHEFADLAAKTDRFVGKPDHAALLAAGLFGEAGSIVAELKKARREREAYPVYRERMTEEVGDFLWYFARLAMAVAPRLVEELAVPGENVLPAANGPQLTAYLEFGAVVGNVLEAITASKFDDVPALLRRVWALLTVIS